MEAEDEDEDEESGDENDGFGNGDEYILILHSVKNNRATHMMGDRSVSTLACKKCRALRWLQSRQCDNSHKDEKIKNNNLCYLES